MRAWRTRIAVGLIILLGALMTALPAAALATSGQQHNRCAKAYQPPASNTPGEFLKLPFRQRDGWRQGLVITQGWMVSEDEEPFVGAGEHRAIDFEFAYHHGGGFSLPVVAAADGCAYFSFQHINGEYQGRQIGLGAGLFVEIIHDNGMVTQYAHLDTVTAGIPYLPPVPGTGEGEWHPAGILKATAELKPQGKRVRQGDTIGTNGDTGITLDYHDAFDVATGQVAPRDRQALPNWESLTNPDGKNRAQVHMAVYGGRDASGARLFTLDPFDRYGQITKQADPYNIQPGWMFQVCPKRSFTEWAGPGILAYAAR